MTDKEFSLWLDEKCIEFELDGMHVFKMPKIASIGLVSILESLDRYAQYANELEARYYNARITDIYLTQEEAFEIKEELERKQIIRDPRAQFTNYYKLVA